MSEPRSSITRNTSTSSPIPGTYSWARFRPRQCAYKPTILYLLIVAEPANRPPMHRYYQPNPNTTVPFPAVAALNDPTFSQRNLKGQEHGHSTSNSTNPNSADGWGLRVLNSQSVLVHGAGLYSFFDLDCSLRDVDGYNLHTIGTTSMINRNGVSLAGYATTSISSRIRLRC